MNNEDVSSRTMNLAVFPELKNISILSQELLTSNAEDNESSTGTKKSNNGSDHTTSSSDLNKENYHSNSLSTGNADGVLKNPLQSLDGGSSPKNCFTLTNKQLSLFKTVYSPVITKISYSSKSLKPVTGSLRLSAEKESDGRLDVNKEWLSLYQQLSELLLNSLQALCCSGSISSTSTATVIVSLDKHVSFLK
jgi:hypothetical protein